MTAFTNYIPRQALHTRYSRKWIDKNKRIVATPQCHIAATTLNSHHLVLRNPIPLSDDCGLQLENKTIHDTT